MTDTQRKEIQRLRQAGIGYVKIAQTLAMSTNTVKSFCQRNPLCVEAPAHNQKSAVCPQCRMPLPTIDGHRARRFCSDICRARYWAEHQNTSRAAHPLSRKSSARRSPRPPAYGCRRAPARRSHARSLAWHCGCGCTLRRWSATT